MKHLADVHKSIDIGTHQSGGAVVVVRSSGHTKSFSIYELHEYGSGRDFETIEPVLIVGCNNLLERQFC